MAAESAEWEALLSKLPASNGKLPVFFFGHGSPLLVYPTHLGTPFSKDMHKHSGPNGSHFQFLQYFGKFLIDHYKPKAIVVFSAHWETDDAVEVMAYDKNHLFYDYYGFPEEMYKITFESKGSPEIAQKVANLLNSSNIPTKTITKGRGLDHGVFIPFMLMFPDPFDIPIVEVSMDSLDPQRLINIGKALSPLRDEGILILSGGLTIHTFKEMYAMDPTLAPQGFKDFEKHIMNCAELSNEDDQRNTALKSVVKHPFFKRAHPRAEHFVPLYVAAGAGSDGSAQVVCKLHGAISIAFGL